jgi:hypothetical protein
MAPIFCAETSVGCYHYSLRNDPEWRSSQYDRIGVVGGDCLFNDTVNDSDDVTLIWEWEEVAVA